MCFFQKGVVTLRPMLRLPCQCLPASTLSVSRFWSRGHGNALRDQPSALCATLLSAALLRQKERSLRRRLIRATAMETNSGMSQFAVGDRVRWLFSNNHVPPRSVGTVVGFQATGVLAEFPCSPMLIRELVSTEEGALDLRTRISILVPKVGWKQGLVSQVYSRLEGKTDVFSYKVLYDSGEERDIDLRNFESKLVLTRDEATFCFLDSDLEKVDEENVLYQLDEWRHQFCTKLYFVRNDYFEVGVTRLFVIYMVCLLVLLTLFLTAGLSVTQVSSSSFP